MVAIALARERVVDGNSRNGSQLNWDDQLLLSHLLAQPIWLPALSGPGSCDCAVPGINLALAASYSVIAAYWSLRRCDHSGNSALALTLNPSHFFEPTFLSQGLTALHLITARFHPATRALSVTPRVSNPPHFSCFRLTSSPQIASENPIVLTLSLRKPNAHLLVPGFTTFCSLHLTVFP